MKQPKINRRFKALIPPLSHGEFRQLEDNILAHGCRDAIKLWRGFIVDGHNRYAICQKHNIPYETTKLRLPSRQGAKLWIIENQQGRRNLSDATRIKLALSKASLLREGRQSHPNTAPIRPLAAKEAGVSERNVYKYMKIQELGGAKLIQQVDSGELKIGTAYGKIKVTTKTVEPLCDDINAAIDAASGAADISNPRYLALVVDSVERIDRICRFIGEKAEFIVGEDDIERVVSRLQGLGRGVLTWQ